ncbi:MAG: tetratricopeptide repeat protein [Alphaproteobacteria bacterium]|nr:tetratricopeptide repeat protein [Alphaproteobacteria bacterium]
MNRDQAVALAIRLANDGKLAAAENLSGQLIAQFPADPNTIAMRAYVLHQMKRPEDAIALLEAAVDGNDKLPVFHSNLCEMYRQQQQLDRALPHGRKAVALAPNYPDAHNNLGIVLFEQRQHEEAEECYRRALALRPNFAEALNNLGNLLRLREDVAGSLHCYEEAVRLRPEYVEALTNAGKAYLAQRQFQAADRAFRKAAEIRPEHMEALTGIAAAANGLGKSDYAMSLVSRLTTMYPSNVEPYLLMAQMLIDDHKLKGAHAAAQQAVALAPDNAKALGMMGRVKREMGQTEESLDWLQRAGEADPEASEFVNQLGVSYLELGEMNKARACFERAIELAPEALRIYANLSNARKFTEADEDYQRFVAAAEGVESLPVHDRIPVYYGLGKAYDDVGKPEKAIDAYLKGARLKRDELTYRRDASLYVFDRIREVFSREALEAKRAEIAGSETRAPIFIVGMPRSGSTLTEQILSSHSQVFGAGEARALFESLTDVVGRDFGNSVRFPEVFRLMTTEHAEAMVSRYLREIPNWGEQTPRFTDKMLSNFYYVGLLNVVMPRAKIVHIRRNPVDTCLSCLTRLFREDMPYSYDFDDLADHYLKYAELMAHWRQVLPEGSFYELRYEDLVSDTEAQARSLLEYLDLPWEDGCLAFHENKRAVKTASVTQVREPIYTRSVERWKKYGAAVQPLADRLAQVDY